MDAILPSVSRYVFNFSVPCICDPHAYDRLGFEDYPTRRGWLLEPQRTAFDIEQDNPSIGNSLSGRLDGGPEGDSHAVAAFLQSWLFFGPLVEMMALRGVPFDPACMVVPNKSEADAVSNNNNASGRGNITFAPLPRLFREWKARAAHLSRREKKTTHYRRASRIMEGALTFAVQNFAPFDQWPSAEGPPRVPRRVDHGVEVSILAMLECMEIALVNDLDGPGAEPEMGGGWLAMCLQDKARALGWCPSELPLLSRGLGNMGVYFAMTLERRGLNLDHGDCGRKKCKARHVGESGYLTRHADGCCGDDAEFVGVDGGQLEEMLKSEASPLPCVSMTSVGEMLARGSTLDLVPGTHYLAISHVWSDGLGNQNGNTLPLCQLNRLKRLAGQLGFTTIWIDTLCVPFKSGWGKRSVLRRMNEVYQRADAVLVLDEDLQLTTIHCSKEEKLLRILLSGWTRRLWTLEEGMLARTDLVFAFRDGIEGIPEAFDPEEEKVAWETQSVLNQVLPRRRVAHAATENAQVATFDGRPWHILLGATSFRSTSRNIDETLCLAHIMGMDAVNLVQVRDEHERMYEFLKMLGHLDIKLPQDLIFTSGPKLPFRGFRWAPISFIDIDSISGEEEDNMGADIGSLISHSGPEGGATWAPTGGLTIETRRMRRVLSLPPSEPVKRAIFFQETLDWRVIVPRTQPVPEIGGNQRIYWNDEVAASIFESQDPVFRGDGPWAKLADAVKGDRMLYLIQKTDFTNSGPAILASSSKGTKHTKVISLPQESPYEVDLEVEVYGYLLPHRGKLQKEAVHDTWEGYHQERTESMRESFERYFRRNQCTIGSVERLDNQDVPGYDFYRDLKIRWTVS